MINNAKVIAFEGIDGSGKTTTMNRVCDVLDRELLREVVRTQEPGGTAVGNKIRQALVDVPNVNGFAKQMMYAAAHLQLVHELRRSLSDRDVVIADRWTPVSGFAYYAHPNNDYSYANLSNLMTPADVVIWCDVDPRVARERLRARLDAHGMPAEDVGGFEGRPIAFFDQVREGYRRQMVESYMPASFMHRTTWMRVDASLDQDAVTQEVLAILRPYLGVPGPLTSPEAR